MGKLSIEQVEDLIWETVFIVKTTGKRVQSRAKCFDITDEPQLRVKSLLLCFSLFYFSFLVKQTAPNSAFPFVMAMFSAAFKGCGNNCQSM